MKIKSFILTAAVVFLMSACGGEKKTSEETADTTAVESVDAMADTVEAAADTLASEVEAAADTVVAE